MAFKDKLTWVVDEDIATGNPSDNPTKGDASIPEEPEGTSNVPLYELLTYCRYNEGIISDHTARIGSLVEAPLSAHTHLRSQVFPLGDASSSTYTVGPGSSTDLSTMSHVHGGRYYTKEDLEATGNLVNIGNIIGRAGTKLHFLSSLASFYGDVFNQDLEFRPGRNFPSGTFVEVASTDLSNIPTNAPLLAYLSSNLSTSIGGTHYASFSVSPSSPRNRVVSYTSYVTEAKISTMMFLIPNEAVITTDFDILPDVIDESLINIIGWTEDVTPTSFDLSFQVRVQNSSGGSGGKVEFTTTYSGGPSSLNIRLHDNAGQSVLTDTAVNGTPFEFSNLSNGVYGLEVYFPDGENYGFRVEIADGSSGSLVLFEIGDSRNFTSQSTFTYSDSETFTFSGTALI